MVILNEWIANEVCMLDVINKFAAYLAEWLTQSWPKVWPRKSRRVACHFLETKENRELRMGTKAPMRMQRPSGRFLAAGRLSLSLCFVSEGVRPIAIVAFRKEGGGVDRFCSAARFSRCSLQVLPNFTRRPFIFVAHWPRSRADSEPAIVSDRFCLRSGVYRVFNRRRLLWLLRNHFCFPRSFSTGLFQCYPCHCFPRRRAIVTEQFCTQLGSIFFSWL